MLKDKSRNILAIADINIYLNVLKTYVVGSTNINFSNIFIAEDNFYKKDFNKK